MATSGKQSAGRGGHVPFSKDVLISEKRGLSLARDPKTGRLRSQSAGPRALRPRGIRRLFKK